MADTYAALRAGSDIAFLGGIVNHILTNGREFREYVAAYTNAATIIDERFADSEDLDGLFSGWDPDARAYDTGSWQYAGAPTALASAHQEDGLERPAERGGGPAGEAHGYRATAGHRPDSDPSLESPRCVFQILKRHFARYTPEMVEAVCGVPAEQFLAAAEALCDNAGRERTSAICYAVGWTQHTVGAQTIRTAAIIQLLLGNIGRPGGGIMALRGHASTQGSTDIPTLYNVLPGYLPMAHDERHPSLAGYIDTNTAHAGLWGHAGAYITSLLKAWWGDAARPEKHRLGEVAGPSTEGRAGRVSRAAEACTISGAVQALAGGRRRPAAVAAGLLLCTGSLLTRFSVMRAGFDGRLGARCRRERSR